MNSKKYCFPAIFTPEKGGKYSVYFPDLEGCYTCGDNLPDALMMAEDVLAYTLYDYEKEEKLIPSPTDSVNLKLKKNEFINLVACDTLEYRKRESLCYIY